MNQKSIIIRGGYGYSNFGDDALLYVLFRFLKENLPDASISLACLAAQYIENLLGQQVTFSTTESKCDFFILGGGTQFYWFPFDGKQSSLSKRILTEIKSPQVLFGKIQNRLLKTRPNFKHSNPNAERQIALGIGIGPFSANKEAETQARSMLSKFDHVIVRDIKSISYCDSWNFHQHSLGADICYFPDFYIKVKQASGKLKKFIIEVKPKKQCSPPNLNPNRRTKRWISEVRTWGVNEAKWKSAVDWCDNNGMEFKILTEDDLGIRYK